MAWYKHSSSEKGQTARFVTAPGQEGWTDFFGEIQRQSLDPYQISVFTTKTDTKITVSITLNMNMLGICMWQKFWKYRLSEMEKARDTFKKAKLAVEKVFNEFRKNEIPNATMWAYLKDAVYDIDPDNEAKCHIPHINWSKRVKNETDSRQQIYGNRYPKTEGF